MSSEQPKVVRRREVQSSVAIIKLSNHHPIIPEGVRSSSVCHKFYIQLALPISPKIWDGF